MTIGGNLIKYACGIVAQLLSNNGSDRHHLGIVLQQCVKEINWGKNSIRSCRCLGMCGSDNAI